MQSSSVSTKSYWRLLYQHLLSLKLDLLFLKARLEANFISSPLYRRLMAVVFTVVVAVVVAVTHSAPTFIVAWVFPLIFLYHRSALMQFISEHSWGHGGDDKRLDNASKSHGRFCGEAPPPFDKPFLVWMRWGLLMIWHLFVRVAILPGELTWHDEHHYFVQKDWPNGEYERQRHLEASGSSSTEYTEFWGLEKALDHVFQGIAQSNALPEEIASVSSDDINSGSSTM